MRKLLLSFLLITIMGCANDGNPYVPETNFVDHDVVFNYIPEYDQLIANVVIRDLSRTVTIRFPKDDVVFLGNLLNDSDDGILNTYLYERVVIIESENIDRENKLHNLFLIESGEEGQYFIVRSE